MDERNTQPPDGTGRSTPKTKTYLKLLIIDNGVIFPYHQDKVYTENPAMARGIREDGLFILAYASGDETEFPTVGVIAQVMRYVHFAPGKFSFTVQCLGRAKIKDVELIWTRDGNVFQCTWEEIPEPEIEVKEKYDQEFLEGSSLLKKNFSDFLIQAGSAFESIQKEGGEIPPAWKEKLSHGKTIGGLLQKLEATTASRTLDLVAGFCANFLQEVNGELDKKMLAEFRKMVAAISSNERLGLLNAFLSKVHVSIPVTATSKELAKILFYDEKAPPATGLPAHDPAMMEENEEPPSIAACGKYLSMRIIGQKRPIRALTRTINRLKAGVIRKKRPLLVIAFMGPSSVGKTELARALADYLWTLEKKALERAKEKNMPVPFTEEDILRPPLIEINCGDFAGSQSHAVSVLAGSPPGFAGSRGTQSAQPPIFTPSNFPANRFTVLLLDEIEEALIDTRDNGADIRGILVKILDSDTYTNNWGEKVNFENTIIVLTSNIGWKEIAERAEPSSFGIKPTREDKKKKRTEEDITRLNESIYEVTKREWEKTMPLKLRKRTHLLVVFHFLNKENYRQIILKEFRELTERVRQEMEIDLELSEEAVAWLLDEVETEEGVRTLGFFMDKEIVVPLSRLYNLKRLTKGKKYVVGIKEVPSGDDEIPLTQEIKMDFRLVES